MLNLNYSLLRAVLAQGTINAIWYFAKIWKSDRVQILQLKYILQVTVCGLFGLTHWGRVTHICVSKLAIIDSDNGLSPGRRQAIIWTNTGILLIRTLGKNFSEILGKIHSFSSKKMHFKMSSAKERLFSLGLNELIALKWSIGQILSPLWQLKV